MFLRVRILAECEKKNQKIEIFHVLTVLVEFLHLPQKWILSSSVMCIFRKTRANRILDKQCIVFIADCYAQCNQKVRILIIERNYRKVETNQECST